MLGNSVLQGGPMVPETPPQEAYCVDWLRWPRDPGELHPVGDMWLTVGGVSHLPAPGGLSLVGYETSDCPSPTPLSLGSPKSFQCWHLTLHNPV